MVTHEPAGVTVAARGDTAGWKTGRFGVRREVVVPRNVSNAAAATLSELLAGRVAGLHVRPGSGAVGAGAQLRLRGASGIEIAGEPLVVVDGVRVVSDPRDLMVQGDGPVHPSRLDDFVPEDVERVEVLSGPAAIARYGLAGADGVVEVWTRRGEMRAPRFRAFAEAGVRNDAGEYPANYGRVGRGRDGARTTACYLYLQAQGQCTPVGDSVLSFNPLEEASPFRTGGRRRVGASVSGGWMGRVAYAAGATAERDLGVLRTDQRERTDARGSLTYRFANGIEVTGSALHLRNQLELPTTGTILSSRLAAGLLGRPVDDPELRGYVGSLRPAEWDTVRTSQSVRRTLGSAAAHWTPRAWVTVGGSFGIDHVDMDELVHDYQAGPGGGRIGHFTGERRRVRRDAEGFARLEYGGPGGLRLASTLGVERHSARSRQASRFGPLEDDPLVDYYARIRHRTVAAYGRQGLAWHDRLFASATVRRDEEKGREPLHSGALGASWELVKRGAWMDGLRLRAAYARAEREPQLELDFVPVPGQCTPINPCDDDPLVPQRHAELEGGVDATLLGGRVDVSLTGYDRTTRDVLGRRVRTGGLFNEGRVVNRGVEARARVGAPPAARVFWEVVGIGALNRNRLEEFGLTPIFVSGFSQRHQEGHPLGSFFGRRITGFADLDGDGIISGEGCDTFGSPTCEVRLSAEAEYLGSPDPTRMLSLQGRTRVRGVEVYALLEHQGGVSRANLTEEVRCAIFTVCRGALDPSAPLAEQARATATLFADLVPVEDAAFTRLREAAVTVAIPERWARRFGGRGVELTVAGRNLATWTGFSGLDPETADAAGNPFEFRDFLGQPLPRTITTRLDVTF